MSGQHQGDDAEGNGGSWSRWAVLLAGAGLVAAGCGARSRDRARWGGCW